MGARGGSGRQRRPTFRRQRGGATLRLTMGDDLNDEERERLHEALRASWESAQAGRTISAEELLDELDRDP